MVGHFKWRKPLIPKLLCEKCLNFTRKLNSPKYLLEWKLTLLFLSKTGIARARYRSNNLQSTYEFVTQKLIGSRNH